MRRLSWIEKLNRSLELSVDDATREAIMEGSESLRSASGPQRKATWVKNAMERMDFMLDEKTRIEVMERCSCDFEARKRVARRIYEESSDIDDFIEQLGNRCNKLERVGNILYSIKTEGCDCGWVRATKTPISPTFCHCAKGYIAKYFEAVFQKPVRVDIVQAAVWGDEVCRFAIYLDDEILKASRG
jgi:hypothetical protein